MSIKLFTVYLIVLSLIACGAEVTTKKGRRTGSSGDENDSTGTGSESGSSYLKTKVKEYASESIPLTGTQKGYVTRNPGSEHFIQEGNRASLVKFDRLSDGNDDDNNATSTASDPSFDDDSKDVLTIVTPWHGGIIGCSGVTITGAATIDSYDSSDASSSPKNHGQVMTLLEKGHIVVKAAADIRGNVFAMGPNSDITVSGAATIGLSGSHVEATGKISTSGVAASINGSQRAAIPAIISTHQCDPLGITKVFSDLGEAQAIAVDTPSSSTDDKLGGSIVDDILESSGASNPLGNQGLTPGKQSTALKTTGAETITLKAGRYDFPAISIGGSATLKLLDPGTYIIYVAGNFAIDGAASVETGPETRLSLFIDGTFTIGSAATFSKPNSAHKLFIMSRYTGSANGVTINGAADFSGVIYAPKSAVQIDGASDFYGAVRGKTITIKAASTIYFDRFLEGVVIDPE